MLKAKAAGIPTGFPYSRLSVAQRLGLSEQAIADSWLNIPVDLESGLTDIQVAGLKTMVRKGYIISPGGRCEEFHIVIDMIEQRMRHGTEGMKKNLKMANEIIRGLMMNNYIIYSVVIGYKTVVALKRWQDNMSTTTNTIEIREDDVLNGFKDRARE